MVHHNEGFREGHSQAFRLAVNTASNDCEFQIKSSRRFCENQRLESLGAVVNISEVVSKGLVVDEDLASALGEVNLGFAAFPGGVAVEPVGYLFVFFEFVELTGGLLEGEELELELRIDGLVGDVVCEYFGPVFVED